MSVTSIHSRLLVAALVLAAGWPPPFPRGIYVTVADATAVDGDRKTPTCGDASRTPLNSFLWTVERPGGGAPVYFFGTIHVPYTRVWDYIPQNAKDAFRNSDHVFFELDLTNHHTAAQLASCQLLPGGETLDRVLPRDLYRRLKKHFSYLRRKMPEWLRRTSADASALRDADGGGGGARPRAVAAAAAEPHPLYADYQFNAMAGSWERLRPVWVMLTLNSLTESEVRSFGVPVLDLYLSQQAVRWSKHTGAIEKVDEQCTPLNQLSPSQVIFALNQTLTQHEQQRDLSVSASLNDDLIHHYSCGDLDSVLFSRDAARMPALGVSSTPVSGRSAAAVGGGSSSSSGGGGNAAAAGLPSLGPDQSRMAKEIDAYFQTELLYKRNERMADRVAALIRDYPTRSFFFAFGAGHFIGQNTVIDHLQRSGFTVTHLSAEQQIASLSQREFAADMSVPVPLNPYVEALTSFNQMHSSKIRQRLHNQGRRQQQRQQQQQQQLLQQQQQQLLLQHQQQEEQQRHRDLVPSAVLPGDGPAPWWEPKQTVLLRRPERGSTLAPFNSLWQRIGDEEDLESMDVVTPGQTSQPSRIWRPSSSSAAATPAAATSYTTGCVVWLTVILVRA